MAGILYVMIGFPGSGKSYFADHTVEHGENFVRVSRDDIRYQLINDQEHYFDKENEVYREYCNRISMYLHQGKYVLADATHLTHGSRKKLLSHLTEKPDYIVGLWVNTPFETCFSRNALREGILRVPDSQMYKMKNIFQKPNTKLDNFNEVMYVKGC